MDKPFSYPRFAEAMLNFAQVKHKLQQPVVAAAQVYKKCFLLRKGQSLSILPVTDIRLNRSDILHISSILQVEPYNKESVAVVLSCDKEPAISSKTRTALFRK